MAVSSRSRAALAPPSFALRGRRASISSRLGPVSHALYAAKGPSLTPRAMREATHRACLRKIRFRSTVHLKTHSPSFRRLTSRGTLLGRLPSRQSLRCARRRGSQLNHCCMLSVRTRSAQRRRTLRCSYRRPTRQCSAERLTLISNRTTLSVLPASLQRRQRIKCFSRCVKLRRTRSPSLLSRTRRRCCAPVRRGRPKRICLRRVTTARSAAGAFRRRRRRLLRYHRMLAATTSFRRK